MRFDGVSVQYVEPPTAVTALVGLSVKGREVAM